MINITFWEDKNKNLVKKDLFSKDAKDLAREIFNEHAPKKDDHFVKKDYNKTQKEKKINNPAQIRKFYDEILNYYNKLKINPDRFEEYLPYINMINSKLAYAKARNLIGEKFESFISRCLALIKDQKDYEVFVKLFEAFLGYFKYFEESEKKN